MNQRIAAISLKIPDNAAFTAHQALVRLGIDVGRVERADVWTCDDAGEAATFADRVASNEAMFNANKHRLTILSEPRPRPGEVWIERRVPGGNDRSSKPIPQVDTARRSVGWRLFDRDGSPVRRLVLEDAVRLLLCNPAIDEARYER